MSKAISGPKVLLQFDGKPIGWATGCSANRQHQNVRVDALGDPDSKEIEPVGRTVSMGFRKVFIDGASLESLGIAPRATGDAQSRAQKFVEHPYLTGELYNQISDEPVYKIEGLKLSSDNWDIDARGLLMVNGQMDGIRMYPTENA